MIAVRAPGRINLIGEHVDYLGGCVMPIAIDRHITLLAAPTDSRRGEVQAAGFESGDPVAFDLDDLPGRSGGDRVWLNYVLGVIQGYRHAGVAVPGFRASLSTDLPTGAGLSSSAALETAVALMVESLTGVSQDVVDRALICQRAEHEWAGVPCGIMDQLAVGAGRAGMALHLDCRDLAFDYCPLPRDVAVVTADTGVKHALGDGEYRERRESCEAALERLGTNSLRETTMDEVEAAEERLGPVLYRRARHAVSEMARVERFAEALRGGEVDALGSLMLESHRSMRDDYEISCAELDCLVDAACAFGPERGLIGSRMTGGGFGGSTVSLVQADAAEILREHLENSYREMFGRAPDCFITSAVDGAALVPVDDIQPP